MRIYVSILLALFFFVLAAGVLTTHEWIYVKRFLTQPENAGEPPASFYQPTYDIGQGDSEFFDSISENQSAISESSLDSTSSWAAKRNTHALIVLHRGQIALEQYWGGVDRGTLYSGRGMTKSLIGILYGFAVGDRVLNLDEPAANFLTEWNRDERSEITIRHLLENTSGLENPPFTASPFNKQTRLAWGPDIASTALGFEFEQPPGQVFNVSSANSVLLAVVLQRATQKPVHKYFNERLWTPLGAEHGSFYVERPGGRAHIDCCFRATPGDWVRLGYMLAHDGAYKGRQILPVGWVAEMTAPGRHYAQYGLHIWSGAGAPGIREVYEGTGIGHYQSEPFLTDDIFFLEGGSNRVMWISPSFDLVILRLGNTADEWDHSFIPNTIIRGLKHDQDNR